MTTRYLKKEITEKDVTELTKTLHGMPYKLSMSPVCDFCGSHDPSWLYASRRMTTGFNIKCWRWAACDDCDAVITRNDWDELLDKITQRLEPMQYTFGSIALHKAVQLSLNSFLQDVLQLED